MRHNFSDEDILCCCQSHPHFVRPIHTRAECKWQMTGERQTWEKRMTEFKIGDRVTLRPDATGDGLDSSREARLAREADTLACNERWDCRCPLPEPPGDGFLFPDVACTMIHEHDCPIMVFARDAWSDDA